MGMRLDERRMRKVGVPAGERWTCRAWCRGCLVRIYVVENLPESSKESVDRLLDWLRENVRREHNRENPACRGFMLRRTWEKSEPPAPVVPKLPRLVRAMIRRSA
jgi:hypothetical protein